ncbi:phage replisome organizer N-terminal domain-containing protein [Cytobacillus praedii]|uniref:phage replisome organizer N-terminal domain-containing protein n=1 Tax=Cytobacillus praedii TaxID=1742358 RepID=UPI002E22A905|nr:phage replisome organizer N-terminal domain-containing protein [Cytobacillus praedii]
MSEVKWIRLSTQMFEDEKIRLIESMPEADTILIIWVKLLAQAGKTNATGFIYLNEKIPYTDEMLATIFNRPIATVRLALKTFETFGMIEISDDHFINISNWEKHQNVDGLEKIREQNRLRKQREREKKRLTISNETGHVTVTQNHATEIDKELDIDKEKNNNPYSNEFEQFWSIYPRRVDKKKAAKSFKKAIKSHSLEVILSGTEKYAKQVEKTDKQYIKHPTTFLNNDSFIDGYEEGVNHSGQNTGSFKQASRTVGRQYSVEMPEFDYQQR